PYRPPTHGGGGCEFVRHLCDTAPGQRGAVSPHGWPVGWSEKSFSIQSDPSGRNTSGGALSEFASSGKCRSALAGPAHWCIIPAHPSGGKVGSGSLWQSGGRPVQPSAAGGDWGGLLLHQPGERPGGTGLSSDHAGRDGRLSLCQYLGGAGGDGRGAEA